MSESMALKQRGPCANVRGPYYNKRLFEYLWSGAILMFKGCSQLAPPSLPLAFARADPVHYWLCRGVSTGELSPTPSSLQPLVRGRAGLAFHLGSMEELAKDMGVVSWPHPFLATPTPALHLAWAA